jgi:hypothetical protein
MIDSASTAKLSPMSRRVLTRPWLLTLLCALLLATRLGGAHLHLCFDGSEPPASLHLTDIGLHHGEFDAGSEHQDQDIALADEVLAKLFKSQLDLPALLLAAMFLWGLLELAQTYTPRPARGFAPSAAHSLRPPPRGPPHSLA